MHGSSLTDQAKTLWIEQKKARIVCSAVHYAAQLNVKKNRGKERNRQKCMYGSEDYNFLLILKLI